MGQTIQKSFSSGKTDAEQHPLAPFTKATDLYEMCPWDDKTVKTLILTGELAPIVKGSEAQAGAAEECPICFNFNEQMNEARCCKALLCTECFLQVRPPRRVTACPFCNSRSLSAKARPNNPRLPQVNESPSQGRNRPKSPTLSAVQRVVSSPKPILRSKSTPEAESTEENLKASPCASSSERRQLEEAMRQQRALSLENPEPPLPPRRRSGPNAPQRRRDADASAPGTIDRRSRRIRSSGGTRGRGNLGSLLHSSGLEHVEDMMLMEAIRLSLLEAEEKGAEGASDTRPTADSTLPPLQLPPPPLPAHSSDKSTDDATQLQTTDEGSATMSASPPAEAEGHSFHSIDTDNEEEVLHQAIAMSLNSPPSVNASPDPSLGEVEVENDSSGSCGDSSGGDGSGGGGGSNGGDMDMNSVRDALLQSGCGIPQTHEIVDTFGPQLLELASMGFVNYPANVTLLYRYQGRLLRVVNALSDLEEAATPVTDYPISRAEEADPEPAGVMPVKAASESRAGGTQIDGHVGPTDAGKCRMEISRDLALDAHEARMAGQASEAPIEVANIAPAGVPSDFEEDVRKQSGGGEPLVESTGGTYVVHALTDESSMGDPPETVGALLAADPATAVLQPQSETLKEAEKDPAACTAEAQNGHPLSMDG